MADQPEPPAGFIAPSLVAPDIAAPEEEEEASASVKIPSVQPARRARPTLSSILIVVAVAVVIATLVFFIGSHRDLAQQLSAQLTQCRHQVTSIAAQLARDAATHDAISRDFNDVLTGIANRWRMAPPQLPAPPQAAIE